MIVNIILFAVVIIAYVVVSWVHFGKDTNGKRYSFRFKIITNWICLALMGIANILYYALDPRHPLFNLIVGLIILVEITAEAVFIVYSLDEELEEDEE